MIGYEVTPTGRKSYSRQLGHDSLNNAEQAHTRNLKILRAWCDGQTFEQIGLELGVTKQRAAQLVQTVLHRHGFRGAKRGNRRLYNQLAKLMEERIVRLRGECRE